MAQAKGNSKSFVVQLDKSPTGMKGLDEITNGGLPKGRPTLVCGAAGCGKTLFAMEFLVRGATQYNEPGVFMSFEESAEELTKNVASLGFDLNRLASSKRLLIDHVRVERSEIHPLSAEGARHFPAGVANTPCEALQGVARATGLRQGEALGKGLHQVRADRSAGGTQAGQRRT